MSWLSKAFFIIGSLMTIQLLSASALCQSSESAIIIDAQYGNSLKSGWDEIEQYFMVFEGELSFKSIEEIKKIKYEPSFQPVSGQYIPIDPDHHTWIKTSFKNQLDEELELALWIQSSETDVYISDDKGFKHKMAGDFYPSSVWDSQHHYNIHDPYTITLKIPPGESKKVYVRLGPYIYHKVAQIRLSSYSHSVQYFSRMYSQRNLIQGICMGMFIIMFFLNLFIYLSFRDKVYLLNTLYIFCLFFWFLVSFKLDKLTFLGEYPVITELIYNPVGYGIGAFYLLFIQAMLGKQNFSNKVSKLLRYYMYLIVIAIFVSSTIIICSTYFDLLSFANMKFVFPPVGLIGLIISVYFLYLMFRMGTKLARIIAISSCFVLLGAAIAVFEDIVNITGASSFYSQYSGFSYDLLIEITFLIQLLLFGLALGIRARVVENEKEQLKEIDKIKSIFFTNISHEFRTPLTLLLSPVKQVISESKNKKHIDLLKTAHRSGNHLLNLINQILDLSKIDANGMKLSISRINIVGLVRSCLMMFGSGAVQKNISIDLSTSSEDISLYLDRDKFEKVIYNLISNALKFSRENGVIQISIEEEKNDVIIAVKDEGVGIDEDELNHIYDRFYQSKSGLRSNTGSGIGLALVKELVELHKGTVLVESEPNNGTTFTLLMKKGKTHLSDYYIITQEESGDEKKEKLLFPKVASDNLSLNVDSEQGSPVILIIEDHPELHNFIKNLLSETYQVFSAYDGSVGIEKAIRLIPDLIISDVMMPGKDGYEVCQKLKTDERTSHIPIILLTAKADIESKIYGLEIGADDYIAKPFDNMELIARVRNIVDQRILLRQKFRNEVDFTPDEISSNTYDKDFISRVIKIINQNMIDTAFGVDELAREIGMSRTQLNRKLRDLVDQSTNKFIQSCRLKKALELLKNPGNSIAEISYQTGFSSDAYFVKCFKEQFGVTPGKYFDQKPQD